MLTLLSFVYAAPVGPSMEPDELIPYQTPDRWRGNLRHYQGDGPPVLLVHNMGVNHLNWDFAPEVSLAHTLQQDGWNVYVAELPGDAGTTPPSLLYAKDVDFTQMATVHLPAIVDRVLQHSNEDALFWVGHSLGAILLYAAADDVPIVAGVSLAGTAQFDHPPPLIRMAGGIYKKTNTQRLTRAMLWTLPFNPIVPIFANPRNLDRKLAKGLLRHAVEDSPRAVTSEVVDWMRKRGPLINQRNGRHMIDFDTQVPLLALSGTKDRLVASRDAERSCAKFAKCTFESVDGYGHLDLVLGKDARHDVYPLVLEFLNQHRTADQPIVVSAD